MEIGGSIEIAASRQEVWDALNDPDVLRQCIPGCEEVKRVSPEELHARVALALGPVRARFVGKVLLSDVRPLEGYTLNFEGSGGSAGFAKGSSAVTLVEKHNGTLLSYTAQATVAGKLGQVGGRLMDASAAQLAARFFAKLSTHLSSNQAVHGVDAVAPAPHNTALPPTQPSPSAQAVQAAVGSVGPGVIALEAARLIWFFAGVFSTALGVWIGAHWLR